METTTRQFAIYSFSNSAWSLVETHPTAEAAARQLGGFTDGLGVFSPPVDLFADDLSAGFVAQASDRIGTRYAAVPMFLDAGEELPAIVQASSNKAIMFAHVCPDDLR